MAKKVTKKTSKAKPAAKKAKPKAKTTRARQTTTQRPEIVQAKLTPVKKTLTKRPPLSPVIPIDVVKQVIDSLTQAKADLEEFAAHLRSLDRKRLHSIGTRKEGFAQRAYRLAMDNPEFLPNYLSQERYTDDFNHYTILQTAAVLNTQIRKLLLNIDTEAMDFFYTDGLDFYAAVREASNRRVDAAESIHAELFETFFKKKGSRPNAETEKQMLRNAKAIIKVTKDGKFEAVNVKPKLTGGAHEVIDEQFKDTAKFKDSIDGEISE